MSPKQLITVFGATGNQGGSVISTVLSSPSLSSRYALRGVSRDPSKASSQALADKGVEVVKGDMNDVASIASAVSGAYAVFAVTNYWEMMDGEKEYGQGKATADAAFAAGVKHLVWSSLPNTKKLTGGKLAHIDHFDAKARVQEYIEATKATSGTAASYFMPAFFASNIKGMIKKGPDGKAAWAGPWDPKTARIPLIDIRADSGKFVLGLLEAGPQAADGKQVQAVSEWSSPAQAVETINALAGTHVAAVGLPRDVFKAFLPDAIAEELTENMELIGEWSYYGKDAEAKQAESDRFFLRGEKKVSWKEYVLDNGPWEWN